MKFLKAPFAIIAKFPIVMKMVKLMKVLKVMKFGLMAASALISIFVYAFLMGMGWWFSVGFVVMLGIHEFGHVIALKLKKLPASAPVFIPGLGAAIFAPDFRDSRTEAFVGLGGPLLGGLASLITFLAWIITPSHPTLLFMISFVSTWINLFNMIPIRPLDGGRVTQAIGPWFKYIGIAALLLFTIKMMQPAMLLIWIIVMDDIPLVPKVRFGLALTCFVTMVGLMITGFSAQPFWLNVIDTLLALFMMSLYWGRVSGRLTSEPPKYPYPPNPKPVKWAWALRYLITSAALIGLLVVQTNYMPKEIQQQQTRQHHK